MTSKRIEEKDIKKILLNYLKYWYLFLLGGVICISSAFLYLRYKAVPMYQISGKILLNDKDEASTSSGLESLGNLGLLKLSKNIQDEVGVLKSADFMETVVEELDMKVSYYMKGRFSEVEVYKENLPFYIIVNDTVPAKKYGTWGQIMMKDQESFVFQNKDSLDQLQSTTYNYGEEINNPFGSFKIILSEIKDYTSLNAPVIIKFNNSKDLSVNYSNKLSISPVDKNGGGLLNISIVETIPKRGIAVINKLIEVYVRESAAHKKDLANTTIKLINERLELLTDELSGVEKDVESYKKTNVLTDVSSDAERYAQQASEVERQLQNVRIEIDAINSLESSLLQNTGNFSSALSSYNIQNPVLVGLISNYNTLLQERKSLLRTTRENNPLVVEYDKKLIDLKNAIAEDIRGIKSGLSNREANLRYNVGRYRSKISKVPSAERALTEIKRDQGIKQNLYLYLLQKREEEALSIVAPYSNLRIIEKPRPGQFPVSPSKTPIYFGALLFGLFIPFLFVLAKDQLDNKIKSVEDIKDISDSTILGVIAHKKKKEALVVTEKNRTPIAELFRLLRFNLKFIIKEGESQVIMITSGKKGEGKTFFSINMGASFALTGKKAIVLGFDFRDPKLLKDVGLSNSDLGISDYIVDSKLTINDIVKKDKQQINLFYIGSGSIPPNPGELMLSNRIELLINELKKSYDYILIDTPPIGKVADGFLLGPYLDATIYIVRSNYTRKADLNTINEATQSNKLNPVLIVMNDMKMDKSSTYGYGNSKQK